ncbi:sodium:calcium antiporter [Actinomadura verrucosospora]|uniref:Sodium/calcium exchanger membrane protein n=1 Tax=Actinomadura verrucosospora TaxID=46165 RepID=A0A7D4AGN7_ACTVE|nr:sodium:calcium antiporter [Actinomadura verrucosospora]QKG18788.1 sodium/calcium exchanger membrane protein [Actinomadura verrucosospora]
MWHFVLLIVCAVVIYLSCEWFVNAVEWLGRRLNVGKMAVGTILAAFGTALPESVVTLVAVTTGGTAESKDIGVGAAMGGPLALATVAYAVTGVALLQRRRKLAAAAGAAAVPAGAAVGGARGGATAVGRGGPGAPDERGEVLTGPGELARLVKDQRWFLAVFVVKVALGLVAFAFKPVLGLAFFAVYAVYFWREMSGGSATPHAVDHAAGDTAAGAQDAVVDDDEDELEPLKLQPRREVPATWAVVAQTLATLAVIFVSSQLFVHQLDAIGPMIGLPAAVTALLLSPIATELPEIMNAIIWVRQGKTKLALANISGAMMIQATVPSGLGLLFTPWKFDHALTWSGVVTIVAIVYLLATMRAHRLTPVRLAVAGLFYLVFAGGLVFILS